MKSKLTWLLSVAVVFFWALEARAESQISASLKDEAIQSRICKNRMGELIIKTSPGAQVKVEQLRHKFWFGTAISNSMIPGGYSRRMSREDRTKYQEVLAANFNSAVHENALKWHNCERSATGGFDYSVAEGIYRWCAANDISMRGHCIFWSTDRHVQDWVKKLKGDALRKVVKRRANDITSRFKGRIEEFDLNNELIFGNFYRRNLGDNIIKEIADWAKEGNERAVLYLNEQGSLASGGRNADKYVALIAKTLEQGLPIGGIGCQGHFSKMFDREKVQNTLNRLGKFALPIKITEYDFNSSDEQLQARHLREFYEICFAHPSVEGIIMWGFWEGAHWRKQAALWRRDWSEKPAAKAYRDLVFNKWWTSTSVKADSEGICRVRAFYGRHSVESQGRKKIVTLQKVEVSETVTF